MNMRANPSGVVWCATMFVVLSVYCSQYATVSALSIRNKRSSLIEQADKLIKESSTVDVNNVGQLIELVEQNGAEECLMRAICELAQNGRSHGDSGTKFAQSLLKFRQSKHAKVKKYTDAMSFGAKAKTGEQCKSHFTNCPGSTQEVVAVGNKIFGRSS